MSPFSPMPRPLPSPWSLLSDRVQSWAVESQQGARRNAMIATTALAARRAERQDVDAYFASLLPPEPAAPVAVRR